MLPDQRRIPASKGFLLLLGLILAVVGSVGIYNMFHPMQARIGPVWMKGGSSIFGTTSLAVGVILTLRALTSWRRRPAGPTLSSSPFAHGAPTESSFGHAVLGVGIIMLVVSLLGACFTVIYLGPHLGAVMVCTYIFIVAGVPALVVIAIGLSSRGRW